jgi:hypothetical protein
MELLQFCCFFSYIFQSLSKPLKKIEFTLALTFYARGLARACKEIFKYQQLVLARAFDALCSSGLMLKSKTAAFAIALLLTKLKGSFHERLDFII